MPRVEKRTVAELDLVEIWGYVATEATPAVADRLLDTLEETLRLLAAQPEMGRARNELASELRSFPVRSYIVFYHVLPERGGIEVVRVLHQHRDIEGEFDE